MINKRALLIGNALYEDDTFEALPSTRTDILQLQRVLSHSKIGSFNSVDIADDLTHFDMTKAICEFFESCDRNTLAFLYISGHGTRLLTETGEFHFIAKDTRHTALNATSVSASAVTRYVDECPALQKIVMIDCCRSGGFATGLRNKEGGDSHKGETVEEEPPISSSGVYVLSSSRAQEASYAPASDDVDNAAPSYFTAEVVEALRTGRIGKNSGGDVSVDDLFEDVNRRMRSCSTVQQTPVKAAHGVDDRIVLAQCPLTPIEPLAHTRPHTTSSQLPKALDDDTAHHATPSWTRLLSYYRACMDAEEISMPLMRVRENTASYVCLSGEEKLLSGTLERDGCVPAPEHTLPLLEAAQSEYQTVWAGYPLVVLHGLHGEQSWKQPRCAPLLIRRVEVVEGKGGKRLKPVGNILPHPHLTRTLLNDEEAERLIHTYYSEWQHGQHDAMGKNINNLLREDFELLAVERLQPDQLSEEIDTDTPTNGARNVAVLFTVKKGATEKLLQDFDDIEEKMSEIDATALATLSPNPTVQRKALAQREREPACFVTPLPCNEGQYAALRSAMTRPLTTVTGPPGSGKSQLITNVIATAVADGQTVLVASTNNTAVDEVWNRCNRLIPGSIIRTGSKEYREKEKTSLDTLRKAATQGSDATPARIDVNLAREAYERVRNTYARQAGAEKELYMLGDKREHFTQQLQLSPSQRDTFVASLPQLSHTAEKAERLATARFFGTWRRKRFLRRFPLILDNTQLDTTCHNLASLLHTEHSWQQCRTQLTHSDDMLIHLLHERDTAVQDASRTLLKHSTYERAQRKKRYITEALTEESIGWSTRRTLLGTTKRVNTPIVCAWAVTSLSARQFPPNAALFDLVIIDEASQCSIPHILPLLFRARRALVIGDPMQLENITTIQRHRDLLIQKEHHIPSSWLEEHRLSYSQDSIFSAAEGAAGDPLLLDEHFRCHPDIAGVVNESIYDDQLTILSDPRQHPVIPNRSAIMWTHIEGDAVRPRTGDSWINRHEMEKTTEIVEYLLTQLPETLTVGVITPFKAQSEAIKNRLAHHSGEQLQIGTIHTFQGGERDVMVFSLVADEGSPTALQWANANLKLWNVAVTRARSHLIVVGNREAWKGKFGIARTLLEQAANEEDDHTHTPTHTHYERLYRHLRESSSSRPSSPQSFNGHTADTIISDAEGNSTAYLLDSGTESSQDPARHLRIMLRRRQLLSDTENAINAIRFPIWKFYDTDGA